MAKPLTKSAKARKIKEMGKLKAGIFFCFILLGAGFLQVSSLGQTGPARRGLKAYQWQNRVLVLLVPTRQHPAFHSQQKLFEGQKAAFADRDLVLLEAIGDQPVQMKEGAETAASLRERYRVAPDEFTLLLLGKDGGEKFRSAAPVPPEKIYGIIDAMPMRKSEMRKDN
jgi:hypothetical protein